MVFNIGDKVRLKDDHPDSQWVVMMIYHDLNKVGILHSNDFGTQMQVVDPLRLTRIDPLDEIKQAIREVLLSEEFLSAFAKAFVNAPMPSTIQPAVLSTQVDRSLVDITQDAVKAQQSDLEQPQLPYGWRWLEVGEVIRKGDSYWYGARWYDFDCSIGEQLATDMWPSIRRNRFAVGEKVVRDFSKCVYEITAILDTGCYEIQTPSGCYIRLYAKDLAPYIEEST